MRRAIACKKVGHHHPGAGGAAVLDQRAGPRLCSWLALLQRTGVINQLLRQLGADRRAAGAGPQQFRHHRCDPVDVWYSLLWLTATSEKHKGDGGKPGSAVGGNREYPEQTDNVNKELKDTTIKKPTLSGICSDTIIVMHIEWHRRAEYPGWRYSCRAGMPAKDGHRLLGQIRLQKGDTRRYDHELIGRDKFERFREGCRKDSALEEMLFHGTVQSH